MIEPIEINVKIVECKCDNPNMILHYVKTQYGKHYIQIKCDGCGCSSPLKSRAVSAVKEWNNHFGVSAKKRNATYTMDGIWGQFA